MHATDNDAKFAAIIGREIGPKTLQRWRQLCESNSWYRLGLVWVYYIAYFMTYNFLLALGEKYLWIGMPAMWIILLINLNRTNVIAHDATHYLLFRNRTLNDHLANFLVAYLSLHDVRQFRKTHMRHHKFLQQDEDPDKDFYILTAKALARDLLLITFFQTLRSNGDKVRKSLMVFVYQVAIFSVFVASNGSFAQALLHYLLFFIYPLFSVFLVILRIRAHAQHFTASGNATTRTTDPGFFQGLFIGQKMEYHFEHHLFPDIPYYNLRTMHERLKQKKDIMPKVSGFFTDSYFKHVH